MKNTFTTVAKVLPIVFSLLLIFNTNLFAQKLVNPNATKEAKALKKFLDETYGKKIISGQALEKLDENWIEIIEQYSGKKPAIMSLDFINSSSYAISRSLDPDASVTKAIDWVKNDSGIVELHWHWYAPKDVTGTWYQAFYTTNTTFDLQAAMANTTNDGYNLLVNDIDLIAAQLKRLQDQNIPVLWRPLHEAEGTWFWWGAKGKEPCVKLWNLMYDRLTNHHKLNNLIWIWNSYGNDKGNWYPGDATVDIIAWDYESSNSWSQYQSIFGTNGKLFALGEEGKLPDPNDFEDRPWLYFITWAYMILDPAEDNRGRNTPEWINQVYNDPRVLTLDDLLAGPKASAGLPQTLIDLDQNGSEQVTLDASYSNAKENTTITSYTWKKNDVEIATGIKPTVTLPIGVHTITLTIVTSNNFTKSANVTITVKPLSVALNKTLTSSSTEANLGNILTNANDGKSSTRWSSLYTDPQWITVDLKKSYSINRVSISWETASAKDYKIQVSNDNVNWTDVVTKTNMPNGPRTDDWTNLTANGRYVRMYGTARNTAWGYSIYEFEVFTSESITSIENEVISEFITYPTLLHSNENLNIKSSKDLEGGHLSVFNTSGKLIKSELYSKNKSVYIDNTFTPGLYILRITKDKRLYSCKFIVE